MPKIKHIARFTTPVKLPTFKQATPTPKNKRGVKALPDRLVQLNAQRLENKQVLLDLIELALIESDQPLTVIELSRKLELELERSFDSNSIRVLLKELVAGNRVSERVETSAERSIRAGGGKVRALHAMLFWAPAEDVPQRTVTEAVPGVTLNDKSGRQPGVKNKTILPEQQVIDALIERIVVERNSQLLSRLEHAEELIRKIGELVESFNKK